MKAKLDVRSRIVGHGEEAPERWRDVVGYEGVYSVSSLGRVRRDAGGRGARAGRILADSPHPQGYQQVSLWRENSGAHRLVHCLVAEAFIGLPPDGQEVNHCDGVKTHNWFGNLEYRTRQGNIEHACALGLMRVVGEDNPQAKITTATVLAVRAAHAIGEGGYKALGARFHLPWGTVRNIVKRKTWASV